MTLLVLTRRAEMKAFIQEKKLKKEKIGFVATMGALHEGHGNLIKQAVRENDICVVSIFVNPIQFAAHEDLSKYPRQFQKDCDMCTTHGVQAIFAPTVEEMYPSGFTTQISSPRLTNFMCGKFRPGHFEGVATVVMLLLNIIQPTTHYWGQKDFQQVQVIKQMCQDLSCHPSMVMAPTTREHDGLALSSRNVYLNEEARNTAKIIPKALAQAAKLYLSGERSCTKIINSMTEMLKTKDLVPQYLEIRSTKDLSKEITEQFEEECVIAIAQIIYSQDMPVRLIDNIILNEDTATTSKDLMEAAHV
jgi:pantoate--beta-alanine ligase